MPLTAFSRLALTVRRILLHKDYRPLLMSNASSGYEHHCIAHALRQDHKALLVREVSSLFKPSFQHSVLSRSEDLTFLSSYLHCIR